MNENNRITYAKNTLNKLPHEFLFICGVIGLLFLIPLSTSAQNTPEDSIQLLKMKADSAYRLATSTQYYDAIKLAQTILDEARDENKSIKAMAHNTLGIAFSCVEEKDGLVYFEKALNIYRELEDTMMIISMYNNIGANHAKLEDIKTSSDYYEKALELSDDYEKYPTLVYAACNLSRNWIKGKIHISKAMSYLSDIVLKVCETTDNQYILKEYLRGHAYLFLGEAYILLDESEKALSYLNLAYPLLRKNKNLGGLRDYYLLTAKVHGSEQEYKSAFETLEAFTEISDSLLAQTNEAISSKVEVEYQLKTQEQNMLYMVSNQQKEERFNNMMKLFTALLGIISLLLLYNVRQVKKKNKALKESKDKMEKLSRAKSDFYSEMSHELRTPLYAVIELSSLLLKENVNSEQTEYLNSLNFSGNHLLNLVNNILKTNELEYGKVKIVPTDFNLKNLVNDVIDSVELAIRDNGNRISLEYDAAIPNELIGDKLKLSQVLINLISNANKFTYEGDIVVGMKLLEDTGNDVKLHIEIKDTGLGIAEEKQNLIFEEFYQGEETTKRSYKGTGLGLSIVKKILEAMGSEIQLQSEKGKGSTFFFVLGLHKQLQLGTAINSLDGYLEYLKDFSFLVVDDNKINQLVTGKVLDKYGLRHHTVSSGIEAIAEVKTKSYDCILMDLNMPEMDGYETTQNIRSFNEQVAIVALTASSYEEFGEKIYSHGMQGYILKPFIIEDFLSALVKAIREKVKY